MKTQIKKIIFTSLSFVGLILLTLPLFLNVWEFYNSFIDSTQGFKLFEQIPQYVVSAFNLNNVYFQQSYATIFAIIAVLALIGGVVYTVFAILELAKVKTKMDIRLIKQISSISVLVMLVLGLVFGSIFTIVNVAEFVTINGTDFICMNSATGFFIFLIGSFVCGLFGLLSATKKLN